MGKQFLDKTGLITLWNKIKSVFATKAEVKNDHYTKSEVNRIQEGNVNALNNKMNNGIIQTYRGNEVSFKTEENVDNVYFNYRSEQSTPITRFLFGKGTADGQYADIHCGHLNCRDINAGSLLKFNGDEARIGLKNSQAEYPLITLKASTTEPRGHGVLIGGGGSVVIGAGESANTVFNSVVPNPGDESVRISADGIICFYPGQDGGFIDKNTYINTNGEYIMNNKKVATEEQVNVANAKAQQAINQINSVNQDKITKGDLVFSLSGSTLTITKRY